MTHEFYTWKTGEKIQFTANFSSTEFECPECSKTQIHKISKDLVANLQTLRDQLGKSITITSGYRTEEHNAKVGGVPNSQHLFGVAADFTCKDLDKALVLCEKLFNGIGDGRKKGKFIHVDMRILAPKAKPKKWSY